MNLRELTSEKHKLAERHPFNIRLMNGELTSWEYSKYLGELSAIFRVLESTPLPHPDMARYDACIKDIGEITLTHTRLPFFIMDSTYEYTEYLTWLSAEHAEQILPHIYLNYMALLFGGQMIKKNVPGAGRIYDFENTSDIIQSIRDIQQDSWADEVNRGFDYIIGIFDELQQISDRTSHSV